MLRSWLTFSAEWNSGDLDSYLIDITAQIFRKIDPETGKPLVDVILDKAGPERNRHVDAAIRHPAIGRHLHDQRRGRSARHFFAQRGARRASKILPQPKIEKFSGEPEELIAAVRDALYASKIISYAQGMELLGAASKEFNWNLNFGDIATIWRGGCIIRAKFLNRIARSLRARSGVAQSASRFLLHRHH